MEELKNEEGMSRTYTQEEVDDLLQRESDRRVSEALKKQERKFSEQQKLSMMNEQEKFQYQLEERERAIAEKERQLAMAEMKATTSKILAEKGLPITLVDIITNEDAELTKRAISSLETSFKEAVRIEVEKRIGAQAPKQSENAGMTIDMNSFKNMSLAERTKLAQTQPEIYNTLNRRK